MIPLRSSALTLQGVLSPQVYAIHAAYRAVGTCFCIWERRDDHCQPWNKDKAPSEDPAVRPPPINPPSPPPNFAHNSDVWFNTLPKYLKPNKQCLTENQQTKQRRLRAFVPDHKPKSEKSVWILIKRLIVEIPFRGRSYQNSCFAQDTCFSLFLWRFKSVWRLDSIMSQLHTVECVGSVTILYGPSIQTKKRALYRNRTGCVCATTFFGNLETVYSQTQGDVCITYIYIFSDQRNHIQ